MCQMYIRFECTFGPMHIIWIYWVLHLWVDPNEYKDKISLEGELSISLFINYNEDKEMAINDFDTLDEGNIVRIDTIGKHFNSKQ